MDWYTKVLTNYVGFQGRARRKEYWMFFLFNIIISIILSIIIAILNLSTALSGLYTLAILLPSLAVGVRRLHDTGRSGLWLLISFVPLIGAIILIVFLCQEGEARINQHGANPKM